MLPCFPCSGSFIRLLDCWRATIAQKHISSKCYIKSDWTLDNTKDERDTISSCRHPTLSEGRITIALSGIHIMGYIVIVWWCFWHFKCCFQEDRCVKSLSIKKGKDLTNDLIRTLQIGFRWINVWLMLSHCVYYNCSNHLYCRVVLYHCLVYESLSCLYS